MSSTFNSSDNKFFLWNLLDQQEAFTNIQGHEKSSIVKLFENHIQTVDIENIDLISKNKKVIDLMIMQLSSYKKIAYKQPPSETIVKGTGKSTGIDINLMKQLDDMTDTLNPSKPKAVDFSDSLDEKLEEDEMNLRLASMMTNRNLDIDNSLVPNEKKAEDWINSEHSENNINLTIGDSAIINDIHEISMKKSVSWSDDINKPDINKPDINKPDINKPDVNKLFNKLKQKSTGIVETETIPLNGDMMNMLLEIKSIQSDILALLRERES